MTNPPRRILVTGARGFIGSNLAVRLRELPGYEVLQFVRETDKALLPSLVAQADAVVHLAGENRPQDEQAFMEVNEGLTIALCDAIAGEVATTGRRLPLLVASSTQAERSNPYGRSKLAAERAATALAQRAGSPVVIYRLPGVFGKWCRPHYNSVVATFCYNAARGLPVQIHDAAASLRLVYVDDVVSSFIATLESDRSGSSTGTVEPEYTITLGALAAQIEAFRNCRTTLHVERVGVGLVRALYATYVSYLPSDMFAYEVPEHRDARGVFVEMLKTPDCGQFSFFTAHPGVTRGGHYHHSKTEKFLVIKGQARFRFRHLLTGEVIEVQTSGRTPQVVDTIPGWSHDITNIGAEEMVVMLWANENFDRQRPDTISAKV